MSNIRTVRLDATGMLAKLNGPLAHSLGAEEYLRADLGKPVERSSGRPKADAYSASGLLERVVAKAEAFGGQITLR